MDGGGISTERPAVTIVPGSAVDIEVALQWALAQSRRHPFLAVHPRELMLDGGYDVVPKGCDRRYHSRGLEVRVALNDDAAAILAALERLDPWTKAVVTANAKACRKPDWMEGVEPRQLEKRTYTPRGGKHRRRKDRKKPHRPVVTLVWENGISPETIRACREIYARWHAGMARLVVPVSAAVNSFHINGFAAPSAPWETALEEIA